MSSEISDSICPNLETRISGQWRSTFSQSASHLCIFLPAVISRDFIARAAIFFAAEETAVHFATRSSHAVEFPGRLQGESVSDVTAFLGGGDAVKFHISRSRNLDAHLLRPSYPRFTVVTCLSSASETTIISLRPNANPLEIRNSSRV